MLIQQTTLSATEALYVDLCPASIGNNLGPGIQHGHRSSGNHEERLVQCWHAP